MKLTRRSFLGLLSAIPFTPLVAKDMADFEFLPPMVETITRPSVAAIGSLRYDPVRSLIEVYTSNGWQVMETELERQERQDA